jgi:hypothetical protein
MNARDAISNRGYELGNVSSPRNRNEVLFSNEDKRIAEALRREAEIEADTAKAISLALLDSQIQGGVADASRVSSD